MTLRRIIHQWQAWRSKCKMYRAYPHIKLIDDAIAAARREHRQVNNLLAAKREAVNDAMRKGIR